MAKTKLIATAVAAGLGLMAVAGPAAAEDREFSWSATIGGTSDYIFRGISLNTEDPAFQPSIDMSYGIFYAGVWGSNVAEPYGPAEVDFYAGIKPVLGPVTFDFGTIVYWYPDSDADLDYIEFKAGAGVTPVENLALGVVFYWTPDQGSNYQETWTVEGSAGYTFPAVHIFTPTINGGVGFSESDGIDFFTANAGDNYTYWHAGLALAVEKFVFDFRYWDTDIDDNGLTDERFVFSAKVTLP